MFRYATRAAGDDNAGLFTYVHNCGLPVLTVLLLSYLARPTPTASVPLTTVDEDGNNAVSMGGPWSTERSSTTPANPPGAPGVSADATKRHRSYRPKASMPTPLKFHGRSRPIDGGAAITSYEIQVRTVAVDATHDDLAAAPVFFEGDNGRDRPG